MSSVIHVNKQEFQKEVVQSQLPVVVDFYASWCPPCRALSPVLDRLAKEFSGQIKFVKVNSDEEPELTESFGVTGLPTLVLLEGGKVRGKIAGLPQEGAFRGELRKWVGSKTVSH